MHVMAASYPIRGGTGAYSKRSTVAPEENIPSYVSTLDLLLCAGALPLYGKPAEASACRRARAFTFACASLFRVQACARPCGQCPCATDQDVAYMYTVSCEFTVSCLFVYRSSRQVVTWKAIIEPVTHIATCGIEFLRAGFVIPSSESAGGGWLLLFGQCDELLF